MGLGRRHSQGAEETPGDTAGDSGRDPLAAQVLVEEQQVTALLREMHEEDGACRTAAVRGWGPVRRPALHTRLRAS